MNYFKIFEESINEKKSPLDPKKHGEKYNAYVEIEPRDKADTLQKVVRKFFDDNAYYKNNKLRFIANKKEMDKLMSQLESFIKSGDIDIISFYKDINFDELHREDGPAVQEWNSKGQKIRERWYLDDKLHREDGSALQRWNDEGQKIIEKWFLSDKEVNKSDVVEDD